MMEQSSTVLHLEALAGRRLRTENIRAGGLEKLGGRDLARRRDPARAENHPFSWPSYSCRKGPGDSAPMCVQVHAHVCTSESVLGCGGSVLEQTRVETSCLLPHWTFSTLKPGVSVDQAPVWKAGLSQVPFPSACRAPSP